MKFFHKYHKIKIWSHFISIDDGKALNNVNNELNDYNKTDSSDEIDEPIFSESNLEGYSDFYKDSEDSKVWWIDKIGVIGEFLFSFDKKKIYNLFLDYPHNMTEEEIKIFDSENPFWRDFFSDRKL